MSRGSSSGAIIPFGGPWWSVLLQSSTGRPGDRALGAAATLGLSIVILRLVAQAFKESKRNDSGSTLKIIQGILRRLLTPDSENVESADSKVVLHRGSCHCRAVAFELVAPRTLVACHGPGKISYTHTRTEACNFRFTKGTEHLQMYYVSVPASSGYGVEPSVGAHTFCSRCGVHILHAPNPDSNKLDVNVDCVEHGAKIHLTRTQRSDLSDGVPVDTQWEEDEAETSGTWASMEEASIPFPKLDEHDIPNGIHSSDYSSKVSGSLSPETSTTVGTSAGTDSVASAMRLRSFGLEVDSTISEESGSTSADRLKLLPPLNTNHSSRSLESPGSTQTSSTTPMMRDQLKYYISKHLPGKPTCETSPVDTKR